MKGPGISNVFGRGQDSSKQSSIGQKAPAVLLGELLIQTKLIRLQDLADAIPISHKTGLPIGRILIGFGAIKETTMHAVLFAQSLIRDGLLDEQLACEAIKMADRDNCRLDNALKYLNWQPGVSEPTNRLGELFLEAGVITQGQLDAALEAFASTGLPLARVLVLQQLISAQLALTALITQRLLRDNQITRKQATDAICSAHNNNTSLEDSLNYQGHFGLESINAIRLGELLLLANVISDNDLLERVERNINNNQLIGETLVLDGKISQRTLDSALELQDMVAKKELEPSIAGEVLRKINTTEITLAQAIHELSVLAPLQPKQLVLSPNLNFAKAKSFNITALQGLMPAEKVAESLGISVKTVIKRIQKGALSGFKEDGKWFVKFLERPADGPSTEPNSEPCTEPTLSELNSAKLQASSQMTKQTLQEAFDSDQTKEGSAGSENEIYINQSLNDQSALSAEITVVTTEPASDKFQLEQPQNQGLKPKSYRYPRLKQALLKDHRKSKLLLSKTKNQSKAQIAKRSLSRAGSVHSPIKLPLFLTPELGELITQHLELLEQLSLRNEKLSYRTGYLEGRLLADLEISSLIGDQESAKHSKGTVLQPDAQN